MSYAVYLLNCHRQLCEMTVTHIEITHIVIQIPNFTSHHRRHMNPHTLQLLMKITIDYEDPSTGLQDEFNLCKVDILIVGQI